MESRATMTQTCREGGFSVLTYPVLDRFHDDRSGKKKITQVLELYLLAKEQITWK
jgi:hypothetical protein